MALPANHAVTVAAANSSTKATRPVDRSKAVSLPNHTEVQTLDQFETLVPLAHY